MDVAQCYLDGNVDAVEFCPHDSFHHVLAASTYTLQEGDHPHRSGSLSLYSVDAHKGNLELLQYMDTVGIFDIKWNTVGANVVPLIAQADADGYLRVHSLGCSLDDQENRGGLLTEVTREKVSSSMCLCLDWNPLGSSISVGLSDGSISIVTVRETQLSIQETWVAHDYEVWATSFDTHHPQMVYSGADDCRFSCWDLRESPSTLAFQNTKAHTMGVCCITKSPTDPNKVLTGSYDEHLRVWDVRSMTKPLSKSSICLGGGVWRIKYHPSIPNLILAACMHNGFAVVSVEEDNVMLMENYGKHNSLAYGADWQRGPGKRPVVATCSFYDRHLRIWIPETAVNITPS